MGNYFTLKKVKKTTQKVTQNVICYFRKLRVGVVNDYSEISMTMRTLFENFEGFSQILKEQSGKKGTICGCVYTLKSKRIEKIENRGHRIFELCDRISSRK